jgi:hypothetical protein
MAILRPRLTSCYRAAPRPERCKLLVPPLARTEQHRADRSRCVVRPILVRRPGAFRLALQTGQDLGYPSHLTGQLQNPLIALDYILTTAAASAPLIGTLQRTKARLPPSRRLFHRAARGTAELARGLSKPPTVHRAVGPIGIARRPLPALVAAWPGTHDLHAPVRGTLAVPITEALFRPRRLERQHLATGHARARDYLAAALTRRATGPRAILRAAPLHDRARLLKRRSALLAGPIHPRAAPLGRAHSRAQEAPIAHAGFIGPCLTALGANDGLFGLAARQSRATMATVLRVPTTARSGEGIAAHGAVAEGLHTRQALRGAGMRHRAVLPRRGAMHRAEGLPAVRAGPFTVATRLSLHTHIIAGRCCIYLVRSVRSCRSKQQGVGSE